MSAPIKDPGRFTLPLELPEEGTHATTLARINARGKALCRALGLAEAWKSRSRAKRWVLTKHTAWYILSEHLGYSQVAIAEASGYNSTTVSWVCREKMPAILEHQPDWAESVLPDLITLAKEA